MASQRPDILLLGTPKPVIANGLATAFNLHKLAEAADRDAFLAGLADKVRGFAVTYSNIAIDGALMSRFPRLEIVASFGVPSNRMSGLWLAILESPLR